ncbi:hypothetical protein [Jiangella mangrovi]|uniref:Uncharacterized protein n=1 Tax=Jiangella mangrovi TaxID=1524084 RepID=A0A7W9GXC7_9ACTN|nr:hypothetical protein [Jiangella mangrovi]MBB5791780.1 hypothetical protein [Jiangella mangrovi]
MQDRTHEGLGAITAPQPDELTSAEPAESLEITGQDIRNLTTALNRVEQLGVRALADDPSLPTNRLFGAVAALEETAREIGFDVPDEPIEELLESELRDLLDDFIYTVTEHNSALAGARAEIRNLPHEHQRTGIDLSDESISSSGIEFHPIDAVTVIRRVLTAALNEMQDHG